MRIHPAAKLLPDMSDDEFARLVSDIRENGLLAPIELLDGLIIDGRHRWKACREAKIDPDFVNVELDGQTPAEYVWSLNGARRHLTPSQLAAVAAEIAEAIKNPGGRGTPSNSVSKNTELRARDVAAKQTGASPASTARAQRVKREDPKLFEKIKQGETTVNAATRAVTGELKIKKRSPLDEMKSAYKLLSDSDQSTFRKWIRSQ